MIQSALIRSTENQKPYYVVIFHLSQDFPSFQLSNYKILIRVCFWILRGTYDLVPGNNMLL